MFTRILLFISAAAFLGSCSAEQSSPKQPQSFSAQNTGWVVNDCLVIENSNLRGTSVQYVALDHLPLTGTLEVVKLASEKDCKMLTAQQSDKDIAGNYSTYTLNKSLDGLAVASTNKTFYAEKKDELIKVKIAEQSSLHPLTMCATAEGLSFDIWVDEPFQSQAIWSGYYYLGYDVDRTCP